VPPDLRGESSLYQRRPKAGVIGLLDQRAARVRPEKLDFVAALEPIAKKKRPPGGR
jgi:hypothetical protein